MNKPHDLDTDSLNEHQETMPLTAHSPIDLADLTRRYARYSRSAGGIAAIIGGVLCVAMFIVGLSVELSSTWRVLLGGAPLLWIASKEILSRSYYQRFGRVEQRINPTEKRTHLAFTLVVAFVSLSIVVVVVAKHGFLQLSWPHIGYLTMAIAMPLAVWRWMWSSSDFIVGVSMFCQAAVFLGGGHYGLNFLGYYMLGAGLLSIGMGIKEHREYLRLCAQLFGTYTTGSGQETPTSQAGHSHD